MDLENVRVAIAKAASEQKFGRAERASKATEIRALRRDIIGMRSKGATWPQVAAVLNSAGLNVTEDWIRQTLKAGDGRKSAPRRPNSVRASTLPESPALPQSSTVPSEPPAGAVQPDMAPPLLVSAIAAAAAMQRPVEHQGTRRRPVI
jgi:hypothetical protein